MLPVFVRHLDTCQVLKSIPPQQGLTMCALFVRVRQEQEAAAEAQHMGDLRAGPSGDDAGGPEPHIVLPPAGVDVEGATAAGVPDLALAQRRVKDIVRVLDNFAALREPGRARPEYMEQVLAWRHAF